MSLDKKGRTTTRQETKLTCSLSTVPFVFFLLDRDEKKELITWLGDKQERMEREVEEILKKREKVRCSRPRPHSSFVRRSFD